MLKNILFSMQQVVGPAERIEGIRHYLGRGQMSTQDMLTAVAFGCIVVGFVLLIIAAYIKQQRKSK